VFLRLRGLRGISLLLRYPYASASSNSVSRWQTQWIDGTPLLTKRSDQGATVVAMTAICAKLPYEVDPPKGSSRRKADPVCCRRREPLFPDVKPSRGTEP